MRRAVLLLLAAVCVAVGVVVGIVRFVIPQPPPAQLKAVAPATSGLTRHLALVVVDGLRYDTAIDPAKMPAFSRRMRERASGEIWAGAVSMTSSAVLTYATGQRGGVEQIVNNESGSAVAYENIIDNARAAGLVTAGTGDHAWFRMFPQAWSMQHPDPEGVAIDVDYNAEIFAAANEFLKARPNLLVVHFVTPDHQAHAYGTHSERYRKHIVEFDKTLDAFLESLPEGTTVFVTSDHGATDAGTHGSDTPVQRRSPFVAWGPGIAAKAPDARPLDQIDLPSTFAALLGVSPPAHGRGHVLADWLAVSDEERARIACADLDRLITFAKASGATPPSDACTAPAARERITRAAAAARGIDEALGAVAVGGLAFGWLVPLVGGLAALAVALIAVGRRPNARAALAFAAVVAIAVWLTRDVERLSGQGPNAVRATFYVLGNLALLIGLIRLRKTAAWFNENPALAAVILPGLLLVTPTRTTQIESFVLAAVIGILALTARWKPKAVALGKRAHATALVPFAALAPIGLLEHNFIPKLITAWPLTVALLSIAALGAERAWRASRGEEAIEARRAWTLAGVGVLIAGASLVLRRFAPAPVCLVGWLGLPVVAAFAWRRDLRPLGELLLLASYAWISRDLELPVLAGTFLVASAVGRALARELGGDPPQPLSVIVVVTFLFGWTFVQRVGIVLGIDFMQLDWGAGAFRDPSASLIRIGIALVTKHALARAALLYAVLSVLAPSLRGWSARGLLAAEAIRVGLLVVVLTVCGESFWTSLRVIGDLPHALIGLVVAAIAVVLVTPRERLVERAA